MYGNWPKLKFDIFLKIHVPGSTEIGQKLRFDIVLKIHVSASTKIGKIIYKFLVAHGHFKFSVAHGHFKFSVARGHLKFSVAHGHFKFSVTQGHSEHNSFDTSSFNPKGNHRLPWAPNFLCMKKPLLLRSQSKPDRY